MYHANLKIFSRGKITPSGKPMSAVAGAAYRAGLKIKNGYDGVTHNYSKRKDVVYTEVLLPGHAPERFREPGVLWNEVEIVDKAKNAQLARQFEVALPVELTEGQNIALAKEIAASFVDEGMVAHLSVHDDKTGNPHVHIMLTMRPLNPDGTWGAKSKKVYILDAQGNKIKLPSGQWKSYKAEATDWNEDYKAEEWRSMAAGKINRYLELYGVGRQVDHRSYERQQKEQVPTIHLGRGAHQMELRGIETDRGNINRQIAADNLKLREIAQEIGALKKEVEQEPGTPGFINFYDDAGGEVEAEHHRREYRGKRMESPETEHHDRTGKQRVNADEVEREKSGFRKHYDEFAGRGKTASRAGRPERRYMDTKRTVDRNRKLSQGKDKAPPPVASGGNNTGKPAGNEKKQTGTNNFIDIYQTPDSGKAPESHRAEHRERHGRKRDGNRHSTLEEGKHGR
jgi:hypothetical protein